MATQTIFKQKLHLSWHGYYPYSIQNIVDYVPSTAGVYELSVQLKNGNLRVFYVGQARDLRNRLYEHLQVNESNDCVRENVKKYICHFKFAFLTTLIERDGAERALYFYYNPECNDPKAIPSGPDVTINPD